MKVAALILTYNRPDRVSTWRSLDNCGFTGARFLLVADDDPALDEYQERYPGHVITFSKEHAAQLIDRGDNFGLMNASVFPRAVAHAAMEMAGYRWFIMLDDDYTRFDYRYLPDQTYQKDHRKIQNLDAVLEYIRQFTEETGAVVAFSQGGEWMGGPKSTLGQAIRTKRKAMNSFMCDTERPIPFDGLLNEDVNMYTERQRSGEVVALTLSTVSLEQTPTQQNAGGVTDLYRHFGTYVKSMYSVMRCPSAVTCQPMPGGVTPRLHHIVRYDACAPKIIPSRYRKEQS